MHKAKIRDFGKENHLAAFGLCAAGSALSIYLWTPGAPSILLIAVTALATALILKTMLDRINPSGSTRFQLRKRVYEEGLPLLRRILDKKREQGALREPGFGMKIPECKGRSEVVEACDLRAAVSEALVTPLEATLLRYIEQNIKSFGHQIGLASISLNGSSIVVPYYGIDPDVLQLMLFDVSMQPNHFDIL